MIDKDGIEITML